MDSKSEEWQQLLHDSRQEDGPELIIEYRDSRYLIREREPLKIRSRGSSKIIDVVGELASEPYEEDGDEFVDLEPADENIEEELNSALKGKDLYEVGTVAVTKARQDY